MSRRLKITLPETVAAQLDEMAANTGEPVARLAGQMVREGIAEAAASGHVRPQRTRPAPAVLDTPEDGDLDQRAPCEELAFQGEHRPTARQPRHQRIPRSRMGQAAAHQTVADSSRSTMTLA